MLYCAQDPHYMCCRVQFCSGCHWFPNRTLYMCVFLCLTCQLRIVFRVNNMRAYTVTNVLLLWLLWVISVPIRFAWLALALASQHVLFCVWVCVCTRTFQANPRQLLRRLFTCWAGDTMGSCCTEDMCTNISPSISSQLTVKSQEWLKIS